MVARAEAKYIRISPKKVRLVLDIVRGKPAVRSCSVLGAMNKKGAGLLGKVLKSAISLKSNEIGYQVSMNLQEIIDFLDTHSTFFYNLTFHALSYQLQIVLTQMNWKKPLKVKDKYLNTSGR